MTVRRILNISVIIRNTSRRFTDSRIPDVRQVAVVLSGCGVSDGSEVHEASACLVHLSRAGVTPVMFAPDINQAHVVDHLKYKEQYERRNVLVESARIARGRIQPITALKATDHVALVFPGGEGVTKNLSTYMPEAENCSIDPDVRRVIREFRAARKPIALCGTGPILAAHVIKMVAVTIGQETDLGTKWPYAGLEAPLQKWGAIHHPRNVDGVVVDTGSRVVTTPAFMYRTDQYYQVFDGIGRMIQALMRIVDKGKRKEGAANG